ncbi:hypothetical protein HanLR1_Chr02g0046681 [Helianthus annuus]|nr:hypothetical protein HanLR1_Chr02g0046681 [Helianthus annuus]
MKLDESLRIFGHHHLLLAGDLLTVTRNNTCVSITTRHKVTIPVELLLSVTEVFVLLDCVVMNLCLPVSPFFVLLGELCNVDE